MTHFITSLPVCFVPSVCQPLLWYLNIDNELRSSSEMISYWFFSVSNVNLSASLSAGSKVISRKLSLDNLAEVESVLQRPPLIWDNLHANDYDSRRLFLGPFKGREPQLRCHLSGLLLNPNCEFEANYIPLHSLGTWFRTGNDESKGEETGSRVDKRMFFFFQASLKSSIFNSWGNIS